MANDSSKALIRKRMSRRYQAKLVGLGLLVGFFGGGVVTLYRIALSHAEEALRAITSAAAGNLLLVAAWFAALAVMLVIVSSLMSWEPHTRGSGIPQVDAEVMGQLDMCWWRVMLAKFAEGTLCAFSGLSLGREGPSVQLGGVAGKAVSKCFGCERGDERLLVTCGAAAGMSAAFHAPLSGVLFAIEEIHKEFSTALIVSVMAASCAADFLVSQVLGFEPILKLYFFAELPHIDYWLAALLGVCCAFAGVLHNAGMFRCQELYERFLGYSPQVRLIAPFVLAGIMAFTFPQLMCGGDALIQYLGEPAQVAGALITALLVGKYLYTTICFGSGAPGGTLFPLVIMGALLGSAYGQAAHVLVGTPLAYVPNFVSLGVAGLFASVVRAPVTGVVLVFELTGSLDALLSVTFVSMVSYVLSNILRVDPFYEHLLGRLLGTGDDDPRAAARPGHKVLKTFKVGPSSNIEGMRICDVPWPDHVKVVTIERAGQELVPEGSTQILALDTLLVIMNEDVEQDVSLKLTTMTRTVGQAGRAP